jgi:hypothetical protein
MKNHFLILVLLLECCPLFAGTIGFDGDPVGASPKGFFTALTGQGSQGHWIVQKDISAPSPPNVIAQTDTNATSYRFPLCIYDGFSAADVDLAVKFKTISGKKDQAAGLVWQYQDTNNYYVVRANALEDNVVLYKVENGKRSDLKPKGADAKAYGVKTPVGKGEWQTLRVYAKASVFKVFLNGGELFQVEDGTFTKAGKVGLWTKADSVTLFDDFSVSAINE